MDIKVPKKISAPAGKKRTAKKMKFIIGLLFIFLFISLCIFSVWWCRTKLFTKNPRFTLKRIDIRTQPHGYWEGREASLWRRLDLKKGENLFAIDLKKTRQRLLSISNLSNAEVEIVLPDTLKVDLTERVPRAFLGNPNSPWVLDDKSILVPRSETVAPRLNLPVIAGCQNKKLHSGMELSDAHAAMTLIMTVNQYFPKIKVLHVSCIGSGNPVNNRLEATIRYFDREVCILKLPAVDNRNICNNKLISFENAIENARREGDNRNHFNLLYRGKVIIY